MYFGGAPYKQCSRVFEFLGFISFPAAFWPQTVSEPGVSGQNVEDLNVWRIYYANVYIDDETYIFGQ